MNKIAVCVYIYTYIIKKNASSVIVPLLSSPLALFCFFGGQWRDLERWEGERELALCENTWESLKDSNMAVRTEVAWMCMVCQKAIFPLSDPLQLHVQVEMVLGGGG